jgi:hypothetical protein
MIASVRSAAFTLGRDRLGYGPKSFVASIRSAAFTLGRDRLGYGPRSFGTHSIRWCGAAMAMHLGGCASFVIMIIGRWKSAASMEYIREQVALFSEGAVDIDFLPKEVDPIYTTTKTNIGRDALGN